MSPTVSFKHLVPVGEGLASTTLLEEGASLGVDLRVQSLTFLPVCPLCTMLMTEDIYSHFPTMASMLCCCPASLPRWTLIPLE